MVGSVQEDGMLFSVQEIREVKSAPKTDEIVLVELLKPYDPGGCRQRTVMVKSIFRGKAVPLVVVVDDGCPAVQIPSVRRVSYLLLSGFSKNGLSMPQRARVWCRS
jgi:hypothetical protein